MKGQPQAPQPYLLAIDSEIILLLTNRMHIPTYPWGRLMRSIRWVMSHRSWSGCGFAARLHTQIGCGMMVLPCLPSYIPIFSSSDTGMYDACVGNNRVCVGLNAVGTVCGLGWTTLFGLLAVGPVLVCSRYLDPSTPPPTLPLHPSSLSISEHMSVVPLYTAPF